MGTILPDLANFDSNAITAWSTVVLAFVTTALAALTAWLAIEQRKTRREAIAPDVVVTIEPAHTMILKVCIQNIGRGIARDISVKSNPLLMYNMDKGDEFDLTKTKSFNPKFLKPGQKIDRWLGRFGAFTERTYGIEISFRDAKGRPYRHCYEIEVGMYDRAQFHRDHLAEISKGLGELTKSVSQLGSQMRPLEVNTYNAEDRAANEAAELKWLSDVKSEANGL